MSARLQWKQQQHAQIKPCDVLDRTTSELFPSHSRQDRRVENSLIRHDSLSTFTTLAETPADSWNFSGNFSRHQMQGLEKHDRNTFIPLEISIRQWSSSTSHDEDRHERNVEERGRVPDAAKEGLHRHLNSVLPVTRDTGLSPPSLSKRRLASDDGTETIEPPLRITRVEI